MGGKEWNHEHGTKYYEKVGTIISNIISYQNSVSAEQPCHLGYVV
jgi:hypothetical protein